MPDSHKPSLAELRIDRDQNRRRFGWWWILIVLVVLAAGALIYRGSNQGTPVRTEMVREIVSGSPADNTSTVLDASGYVTARRQATVSSKTTGKIVEVLVEEGMKVKQGEVLARLDDSNLRISLQLAQAQLNSARTAMEETQVRLEEARREFRRVQQLISENIASASDFDRAEAEVKSLEARLVNQQAQVAVAEQQAALYQQQLEDLVIRAPFEGVVVSKDAQPGEMISPVSAGGGFTRTGICTLVDMDSLEIEVDVNEAYINRVQTGQPVTASLDAYPNWEIPGKVIAIIPTADRQKATVKVRIAFDELDSRILPDMGIEVAIQEKQQGSETKTPQRKLSIPASAIHSANGSDFVWLVRENALTKQPITVASRTGNTVVIQSGLAAGERVVIEGPGNLQEGQSVVESQTDN